MADANCGVRVASGKRIPPAMAHPSGRTVWTGLLFGLAVAVLGAYQQLKLPPVLPEMLAAYGYPKVLAGGFMSVFAVAGLALSFSLGRMMQTQGTARFLVGAATLAAVGAGLILAAPENGWIVLAGRALEGVAMAILAVAGPTLMTRNVGPDHLPLAGALAATWIPLGGLLASGVVDATDRLTPGGAAWPYVFGLGILFSGAVIAATLRVGRRGSTVDLRMPVPQKGAVAPSARLRTDLILAGTCFFCWSTQNMAFLTWLPTYLTERQDMSGPAAAQLYMVPVGLIGIFSLVAIPILRRGVPIARLLTLVLVGQVALFAAIALLPIAENAVLGVAALALYGALAGLTPSCLYGLPAAILGGANTGAGAFGILMTGRNMGVLCGPLMVAGLLGLPGIAHWDGGWGAAAAGMALATLAAAAVAVTLARRLR